MRDWNVHLTRLHVLQYIARLRAYISALPDSEPDAHAKLLGSEGVKTGARIADFVLRELGHSLSDSTEDSRSIKAARQVIGNGRRG